MASHCGSSLLGGASVNDGTNPDEFTLHYITFDQISCMVLQFGRGVLMANFDGEVASWNIADHPSDSYLLGMRCHNQFYVDLALWMVLPGLAHLSYVCRLWNSNSSGF